MIEFEEGEVYDMDELPDSTMTKSGNLEWVGDDEDGAILALTTEDGQVVEFHWSHVECTDVKYLDKETGDLYETREEAES